MPRTTEKQSISAQQAVTYVHLRRLVLDSRFVAEFNDLARRMRTSRDGVANFEAIVEFQNRWHIHCLVQHPEIFRHDLTEGTRSRFIAVISSDLSDGRLLAPFIRAVLRKALTVLRRQGCRVPRWRFESVLEHFRVYDLRERLTLDEVAAIVWPAQWAKHGGWPIVGEEKSYLIQRVQDHEKAARKLLGMSS